MGNAKHGRKLRILLGGENVSKYFKESNIEGTKELVEVTNFESVDKEWIAGHTDAKANWSGYFAAKDTPTSAAEIENILYGLLFNQTTDEVLIAPEGLDAVGRAVTIFKALGAKVSVVSPHNGAVSIMAEVQVDGGSRNGVLLSPLITLTSSATQPLHNNGAATTKGARFQLHVTAASAGDTLDVVVDGSTTGTFGTAATGSLTFAANPANNATLPALNGLTGITFKTLAGSYPEIQIGATLSETLDNLVVQLTNLNTFPRVYFTHNATQLIITAQPGLEGNDYTLGASTANITRSGPTLTGGTEQITVATFSQFTEPGSEAIEVAGTIPRYLRVRNESGGTNPSHTFAVAIARLR